MPPTTDQTKSLHAQYNSITGISLPYTMRCHYAWELWLAAGYTSKDLDMVVAYIKSRIKAGKRERESLKLSLLIGDTERFAEDLSMAKAWSRTPKVDPNKAAMLRATGRNEVVKDNVKTPAQVLAGMKALEDFRRMAREL